MACCSNVLDLTTITFCESIELPLTAGSTGTYTIIQKNRQGYKVQKEYTLNDDITFDNVFNENEILTLQVLDPNGTIVEDDDGNDCFRIKVIPYKINTDA